MRIFAIAVFAAVCAAAQERDQNFAGNWTLDRAHSDIKTRFDLPPEKLAVTQDTSAMTVSAGGATIIYPMGGTPRKSEGNGLTFNVATKWEGSALLANIIVGGRADYTMSERWTLERGGNELTITRTLKGRGTEVESTLKYRNAELRDFAEPGPKAAPATSQTTDYVLAPGTRILLRLTNSLNTKKTKPGDQIYLQTAVPVFLNGKLVVPQGSYVMGTVTESKESGRVKGKAALNFRFETLTLPNGVTRDFRSRAGSVDSRGNLDQSEGRITAEGTKGKDAGTVARTTGAGTGIGGIAGAAAGNAGAGLGIGAAAGAIGGLAKVFGSRGQEVVLASGTTMEMVLDREVRFTAEEVNRTAH